ncbi:MAG: esterase-like activity of phytase family protein, partial [Chloroflexi bacterium]|nr:esterase-like activity of phytase family protein [Chloroflexota bacterium]
MKRLVALLIALLLMVAAAVSAHETSSIEVEFLGEVLLPQDLEVGGFTVGGISGLAYDAEADLYYGIADDLSNARYYTLRVNLSDGTLDEGDVTFEDVVLIDDIDGRPFPNGSLDPEGIVLAADGTLYIAAEPVGDRFPAFIRNFTLDGDYVSSLYIDPMRYDPRFDEARGARGSGGFESLTPNEDVSTLYAAFEVALIQDGDAPTYDNGSTARILEYDLAAGDAPVAEYVYPIGPRTLVSEPADAGGGIGLNDLLYIG